MNSTNHIHDKIANENAQSFQQDLVLDFTKRLGVNAQVLDVGCGNSDYLNFFERNGVEYTGFDCSI